jgi:geranylgeranyl diphosphate synthase, type I
MINKLNRVTEFLPEVRERIGASAKACGWPEFETQITRHLTRTTLPPHVMLPIASAAAAGGDPRRALPVAVACAYLIVSMRWFDDAQDRDRPESLWGDVGMGRAVNMAATALTVSWRVLAEEKNLPGEALRSYGKHSLALGRGQELDLCGGVAPTLDDYREVMRGKTGAALALACEVGALAARPDNPEQAAVCGRIGEHMGVLLQTLDDLDGVFHPEGLGDLRAGKITLPVLYGLAIDHSAREELAEIVHCGLLPAFADRALAILESIDTREFLVWCAFEERKQALALLEDLPPMEGEMVNDGRQALRAFADSLMVGWEGLLGGQKKAKERRSADFTSALIQHSSNKGLNAGDVHVEQNSKPNIIGNQIAQAVHGGLTK